MADESGSDGPLALGPAVEVKNRLLIGPVAGRTLLRFRSRRPLDSKLEWQS